MKARNLYSRKRLTSILIKPAGPDCNMACAYCFYRDKDALFPGSHVHRMSDDILEETIRQFMAQPASTLSIGWQGGEPTLMGLPFYEKAIACQIRSGKGKTVGNGLQTNGVLIDREWAAFLKKYNFLVGLSLDGPEHIHDRYRSSGGGQKTWRKAADAAKLLLDSGVSVNALVVVNDYSAQYPREIYDFHKSLGLVHIQFIPCVETDPENPGRAARFSANSEDLGKFLCAIFDLWISDFKDGAPTTFIRFFDSVFFRYVEREPPECDLLPECGNYLVVEHNGDVYACDFFVEGGWKLGNVMERKLDHMLNSAQQRDFGRRKAELPAPCDSCRWLYLCRGGCPKDRIRDPRDRGLNHFCEGFKMFFAHADAELRTLAEAWKTKNS